MDIRQIGEWTKVGRRLRSRDEHLSAQLEDLECKRMENLMALRSYARFIADAPHLIVGPGGRAHIAYGLRTLRRQLELKARLWERQCGLIDRWIGEANMLEQELEEMMR